MLLSKQDDQWTISMCADMQCDTHLVFSWTHPWSCDVIKDSQWAVNSDGFESECLGHCVWECPWSNHCLKSNVSDSTKKSSQGITKCVGSFHAKHLRLKLMLVSKSMASHLEIVVPFDLFHNLLKVSQTQSSGHSIMAEDAWNVPALALKVWVHRKIPWWEQICFCLLTT